jgi:hypothetical protein
MRYRSASRLSNMEKMYRIRIELRHSSYIKTSMPEKFFDFIFEQLHTDTRFLNDRG